jgi:hypothetical protein
MHSFIHLPEYLVAICKDCKVGMSVQGINAHLASKKHGDVPKKERKRVMEEIA